MNTQTSKNRRSNRHLATTLLTAALAVFALPLHAADYTWTGGGTDRSWGTNSNWSSNPAFTTSNNLIFGDSTNTSLGAPSYIGAARSIGTIIFGSNADSSIGIRLTTTATGSAGRNLIVAGGVKVDSDASGNHTIGVGGLGSFRISSGTESVTFDHNGTGTLTVAAEISDDALGKSLNKTGTGTLVFSAVNTYIGDTIVSAGTLNLTNTSEMRFALKEGNVSNSVSGDGTVNFNGLLRLDNTSFTGTSGAWNLVNVGTLNATFGSTFGLAFMNGPTFTNAGGGIYTNGDWTFNTGTGTLTLTVPEPATCAFLAGLAILTGTIIRRRIRA
ncbi:hypothetical protein Ga0100231_013665 [Opitutaceae bacterium TAV4]|nr:hypothetical protein Ga0100231_013665 [Opitutaceae bacterium TAV4]RRJ99457.1 hypothetical protein Ga0100230_015015 [Opitutaceae bacterium TAV3]